MASCQHSAMHITSDEELRSIREALLAREAELRDRVGRVHDDLRRQVTPLPRDAPDAAIVVENDEILHAVGESARAELLQIEKAMERLEAGTYGVCDTCGHRIGKDRLRIVPYAVHCRSCAVDT